MPNMRYLLLLPLLALASCQSLTPAATHDADGVLLAGAACPDFTATDSTGHLVTRADLLGQRTVLWFYPKAATPG
ncbi:MAG: hypothetical protein COA70_09545 [Planctomycetota bacterium]|nr:MAG: hypothetical protein COA70_09545 [Planctomycetota bacterium]